MVLLGDKITEEIKTNKLIIDPSFLNKEGIFDETKCEENFQALKEQVKHASYNIRVGKNAIIEGEKEYQLSDYKKLIIDPFEVAIIETYEQINIPNNMIARWNIRVKLAYKGLIWVGGPQVDPGYNGHLYCPIYNMSDKPVELNYRDTIATMDFVKTTEPTETSTHFESKVRPFEFYKNEKLKSALTSKIQNKMNEIEIFQDKIEEKIHKLQTTFLTVIGALFATLSILIISMKSDNSTTSTTCSIVVFISFILSLTSFLLHKKDYLGSFLLKSVKWIGIPLYLILIMLIMLAIFLPIGFLIVS
jgi:deoxycytidine triphosphate deaminase